MDETYRARMSRVLVSNYWGELLLVEVFASLFARPEFYAHRAVLARLLVDETRHAHLIRRLLTRRGHDPHAEGGPESFAYRRLFQSCNERDATALLALLLEFERQSGPTFRRFMRVAERYADAELVSTYSEILNDEVRHGTCLNACLRESVGKGGAERLRAARHASAQELQKTFNRRYLELYAACENR